MKKTIFAVSMFAALIMSGCRPETTNELLGIPDDAILLTTEGFSGNGTKTSVNYTSVQWVNGDEVYLNGDEYDVVVVDEKAYVEADDAVKNNEVYGYHGVSGTPIWNSTEKKLTVTVPSEYTSRYDGGRQVIALPMVAYKAGAADRIEFKHVTAAVRVRIQNTTNYILELDKVVVSSSTLQLSGTRDVTLNTSAVSDQSGEIATDDKSVTINFEDNTFVNPYKGDDDNIMDVQVPVLPVGSGSLTIQIYAHVAGTPAKANTYVYEHTESSAALGRNIMITAGVNLGGANTTATLKGLFTVAYNKQVFFSKGNLKCTKTNGWSDCTWSFFDKQYEKFETVGMTIGDDYSSQNTVSLFGYGTSGYNNGQNNYQPYKTGTTQSDYCTTALTGNKDWGYNAIINAGNKVNSGWRTPTLTGSSSGEWYYILKTRTMSNTGLPSGTSGTNTSAHYMMATIAGIYKGLVIFPDNYVHPGDVDFGGTIVYDNYCDFTATISSTDDWKKMEDAGAIFLPASNYRNNTTITQHNAGTYSTPDYVDACYYLSSSYRNSDASIIKFAKNTAAFSNNSEAYGYSVRLVLNY